MFRLDDKTALITGAGSGIGEAIVQPVGKRRVMQQVDNWSHARVPHVLHRAIEPCEIELSGPHLNAVPWGRIAKIVQARLA